jgi:hypothetical protein
MISRDEIHKAADIIINVLNKAEEIHHSYTGHSPAKFNIIECDEATVEEIKSYRDSRKIKKETIEPIESSEQPIEPIENKI